MNYQLFLNELCSKWIWFINDQDAGLINRRGHHCFLRVQIFTRVTVAVVLSAENQSYHEVNHTSRSPRCKSHAEVKGTYWVCVELFISEAYLENHQTHDWPPAMLQHVGVCLRWMCPTLCALLLVLPISDLQHGNKIKSCKWEMDELNKVFADTVLCNSKLITIYA